MLGANSRIILTAATVAIMIAALAQYHGLAAQGHVSPPAATVSEKPFSVEVYGAFRFMNRDKNYQAHVELGAPLSKGANVAVGAASELRGEITFVDGKPIISYGKACPACPPPHAEVATLLAVATVTAWAEPIPLPQDLSGEALDRFIVEQAKKARLDVSQPLPVRIKGTLVNVKMHIISSPNPKFTGHGSKDPMAIQEDIKAAKIEGEVVGMYAPEPMQGIITHPGEPFHYHWVDVDRTRTAHLDAFGMSKGSHLLLPKK